MNEGNYVQNMIKKYQKLKEALMEIGPIQQGTILPRTIQKKTTKEQGKMKRKSKNSERTVALVSA